MTKFVCRNCGFRVESERGEKCPWCNRASLEKEKNAEELLDGLAE